MKQYQDKQILDQIQNYIEHLAYTHEPEDLYKPIEYVLGLGGKRIRPILMLMAYNLYKDDIETIFSQAAAIETYHNFTLLHDDLMDNADMRRNRPTVHKKWNENTAILSGDTMLILSYQMMINSCPSEYVGKVMETFGKAALEVCEGQQWDMDFETRLDVSADEYMKMICLKTSVLLAASLKIGAILGGASCDDVNMLYDFGVKMGLAFQLQDDYLDVYADPNVFGKNIGGDICSNKKTYMLITALEKTEGNEKAGLLNWINAKTFDPSEKIKAVTEIYNNVGVPEICLKKINTLYDEGLEILNKVSVEDSLKDNLRKFTGKLMNRSL